MIVAAGLLVLLGLGLFVAGILTGETALYWACVGACVVAAVLLFVARRRLDGAGRTAAAEPAEPALRHERPELDAPVVPMTELPPPPATGPSAAVTPVQPVIPPARAAEPPAVAEPPSAGAPAPPDPPVEEVEVSDLLLVVDLRDDVLVVDEHPRYHLPDCGHLAGQVAVPLPLDEARADGFTPCALCTPDRRLAQQARERRALG